MMRARSTLNCLQSSNISCFVVKTDAVVVAVLVNVVSFFLLFLFLTYYEPIRGAHQDIWMDG